MKEYIAAVSLLATCKFKVSIALVGSQHILGGGKDYDLLWLVDGKDEATAFLLAEDYVCEDGVSGGDPSAGQHWRSMRKGLINVILTTDREWFDKFVLAAEVCKYLKLANKDQRKGVHRIIRDAACAETA